MQYIYYCSFTDEIKQLEFSEPLQVSGGGGFYSDKIQYTLSLAKDHPNGEESTIINDESKDLIKFKETLDFVKNEKQVLILIDTVASTRVYEAVVAQLPYNSYVEHNIYENDNDSAAAWVEHQMTRKEENVTNEKLKFLIAYWFTAAGYEVPALIFVNRNVTDSDMPTHIQRAKAKLIIYHNPNMKK